MSLILDALRKSERARQQTLNGQISNVAPAAEHSRLPTPWVTLIGLVLLLNAIVLAYLLWRTDQSERSVPAAVSATTTTTAAIPAAKPLIRPLADEVIQPRVQAQTTPTAASTENPLPAAGTVTAAAVAPNPDSAVAPLDSLPQAFQQSLPALHLDVHSYAANPADRFVVINMQRYVAGDTLKEGPRVIAITQQGVVLEYQGTRFLLPRD